MASINIKALLKNVVAYKASDLHLVSRSEPQIRIDGKLVPLDMDKLDGNEKDRKLDKTKGKVKKLK